jgi:hypothetical protein
MRTLFTHVALGAVLLLSISSTACAWGGGSHGSHGGFGGLFGGHGSNGSHSGHFGGLFHHNHGSSGGYAYQNVSDDDCDCGCDNGDDEAVSDDGDYRADDKDQVVTHGERRVVNRRDLDNDTVVVEHRDGDRRHETKRDDERSNRDAEVRSDDSDKKAEAKKDDKEKRDNRDDDKDRK